MLRREFLTSLMALAASPAFADGPDALPLAKGQPFDDQTVARMARALAGKAYKAPPQVPKAWQDLSYDEYVSIWFDVRHALLANQDSPLRVDFFAPGLYFPTPVTTHLVDQGKAHQVGFDLEAFDKTDKFPSLPIDPTLGYSGLRLRSDYASPGIHQEVAVFQGASYFRAIGEGDIYGLSARGLALNTAEPTGEEFPEFRQFWIEKPHPTSGTFRLHALLDSPSCTGAYRFEITPGQPLVMEVEAQIFAREDMAHIGLAPLTSMFYFDQTNRDRFSDFRPAVHDSDGLLIENGAGETLWRPLANPRNLQISAFVDDNPRGFGLMQRARRFGDFNDLEAHYHRRPGLWVEPRGDWGKGAVTLVEIPTDKEIYDNIVAYWRPSQGLKAGTGHTLRYRLTWGADQAHGAGLPVLNTAIGAAFDTGLIAAIDFAPGPNLPDDLSQVETMVRASAGRVSKGVLQRNPETGGPRFAFKFDPGEAQLIEFRADLKVNGTPLSETWLYRWTA